MTNQLNSGAANRRVTEGTGTVVWSGRPGSPVRRRAPGMPLCVAGTCVRSWAARSRDVL